ncbi:MAG: chemotaxis protein CheA [Gammaproteobacteria bacterium]|nr:MAG: chemotaxis protein CheA [Gammaproteobacteria bacterium]
MSYDLNDEILQDFLVEADELMELLAEQLVDLERTPEDSELLAAIFRAFHTVKGGAGFLAIAPLVDVCHRAEDVFNVLRQGDRIADTHLMDVILQVMDSVNAMFDTVRTGEEPEPTDPSILRALEMLAKPATAEPVAVVPASVKAQAVEPVTELAATESDDITDAEFEAMLDQLHGQGESDTVSSDDVTASMASNSDIISEDEFESMLDDLYGQGPIGVGGAASVAADKATITPEKMEQTAVPVEQKSVVPVIAEAPVQSETKAKPKPKPPTPKTDSVVRVNTERLDEIMNMVGELVLVRNRLQTLHLEIEHERMAKAVSDLDLVTSDLQAAVMKTRMQPIKKVFGRFPRVVRDLARSLNKDIELELVGEDTDMDKNMVEALADPLVHLVRNSVDHGVEIPSVREAAGKPRQGKVLLSAAQQGDHILLTIEDDGAGMDADVLRNIAVKKGLMDQESAARLDDRSCYNLIFMAGFSTKETISDVSGRGVGMDVVNTRITQLGGSITIDSELGRGTIMRLKLPLTLAILPTLMIVLKDQTFALPLTAVVEIFHVDVEKISVVDGNPVIVIRNQSLPLLYIGKWLVNNYDEDESNLKMAHVVVVNVGSQQLGFVVDQLVGQEEVVIKPLGAFLRGTKGLSGATITGNGQIALILDVPGLVTQYQNVA